MQQGIRQVVVLACALGAGAAEAQTAGRSYYFSDCQPGAAKTCVPGDDANAGTSETSPKRTLAGLNINALPAGSRVLLARGGAWVQPMTILDNPNATPELPLVIDAYGTGERPWVQAPGQKGAAFAFGKYNNTSNDGGYTIRNLKIDGMGSSSWGLFLVHNLRSVTIERTEITGFFIGIHSQARLPHGVTRVAIRDNIISRNSGMGILGQFSDSVIEGNVFEGNNFSGSAYNHAIYLSGNEAGGRNNIVRNNTLRHNSVVEGVCRGGNITVHGQVDGLLFEGNTIEQAAAARSCRGFSITSGYKTPEWFRHVVVRNNTLVNLGGCGVCVDSAPGIVVENNRFFNDQITPHTAVSIRDKGGWGDDPDRDAVVRNNIACFPTAAPNQSVAGIDSAGATVSGNVAHTGAAGAAGVCAR